MCGIVGIISGGPVEAARKAVRRMIASVHHRGPDGSGEKEFQLPDDAGSLVLGHARLSIIDLAERSNQPMADEHSGSWIVYNGEIYNFRELRKDLETNGAVFRTSGDTEVLLKALVEWGTDALHRLEGMFAFAYWDGRKKKLLLARDPLGIKPLYYFRKPGLFLFGSEIKALHASGLHDFALDREGLDSYLTYGSVIGPSTALKGVSELVPGHTVTISHPDGTPTIREYWSISGYLGNPESARGNQGFEQVTESIERKLRYAVKSHLVSDVPVGVFLSGGVDSNLIARMAALEQREGLNLLTVDYDRKEFSELKKATLVANQLRLPHRIVNVSGDIFKSFMPKALESLDQPTVDGINTFVISRAAASVGLKVLLSGVGGDELFGGYTTFRKVPLLFRHYRMIRPMAFMLRKFARNSIQWEKVRSTIEPRDIGDVYLLQRCVRWSRFRKESPEDTGRLLLSMDDEWNRIQAIGSDYSTVAGMEIYFYMRNQLLRDTDVASMANSVEIRVPFLDLPLVKAALQLTNADHFDFLGGKKITRTILRKVGDGNRVQRKKQGFLFPWEYWLRTSLKEMITETLLEKKLYHPLSLDSTYGQRILDAFQKGDPLVSWAEIWSLFVLLDWQRRYRYGDVSS